MLPVSLGDVLVRVEEVLPHPLLRVEGLAAHGAVGDGGVVVDAVDVLLEVALRHEGLAAERAVEEPAAGLDVLYLRFVNLVELSKILT